MRPPPPHPTPRLSQPVAGAEVRAQCLGGDGFGGRCAWAGVALGKGAPQSPPPGAGWASRSCAVSGESALWWSANSPHPNPCLRSTCPPFLSSLHPLGFVLSTGRESRRGGEPAPLAARPLHHPTRARSPRPQVPADLLARLLRAFACRVGMAGGGGGLPTRLL